MTRNLLSGRISGSGLISYGDNQINQFENDVADVLGMPTDTILTNPIWGIDGDGNITHWTNDDDPSDPTYGVATIKDQELYAGLRIWDTTTGREVYLNVRDGKFIIREAATPGQELTVGSTWYDRLSLPLAAAAGQEIDLNFTGHAAQFLQVSADEKSLVYAASPGLAIPSVQVFSGSLGTLDAGASIIPTYSNYDWEYYGADQWDPSYPQLIYTPASGVYLITAWVHFGTKGDKSPDLIRLYDDAGRANPPGQGTLLDAIKADHQSVTDGIPFMMRLTGVYDVAENHSISMKVTNGSTTSQSTTIEATSLSMTLLSILPT